MARPLNRRVLLAAGLAFPLPAWAAKSRVKLSGRQVQGGAVIGRTTPNAQITLDGELVGQASGKGLFVVGFDRDAPAQAVLAVSKGDWREEVRLTIAPGDFDVQRIDGLPQDQVTPEDPVLLARIAEEAARKAEGFASLADREDFRGGFIMPVKATRVSGRFGGQRILNGVPNRPHYGTDLAAPTGTKVVAPAGGVIAFAESGLHFEGGLILIDHGQGLVSAYLHLSKIMVRRGDTVTRGQKIGEVGQEGRATGPHLCWRLKWRGRNLDPTLLVGVVAPRA